MNRYTSQIMKTIEKELGIKLSDVTIYRLKKISSVSRASEVQKLPAPSQMSLEFPEEEPQAPQYESRGETSYAGAFLFYPALIAMGILPLFQRIYRRIWGRLYGLDEMLLSFIFLVLLRFSSLENFFKYMVENYHLDSLLSYASKEAPGERLVANPRKKALSKKIKRLKKQIVLLEAKIGEATLTQTNKKRTVRGVKCLHRNEVAKLKQLKGRLKELETRR